MELVIEGVLAIQAGANPRVVATKLRSKMQPPGPAATKEAA
jgi:chemotaxis protein MotA